MTTLVKRKATEQQENKLMDYLFSGVYKNIKSRPTLTNENLLVKVTCVEFGRDHFFELSPKGSKINTNLYF